MSDRELRRLERAAAGGDPAAAARLLAARVRAGTLQAARLQAAALLGHGPARAACPDAPNPPKHTAPLARLRLTRTARWHGLRGPAVKPGAQFAHTPEYAFFYAHTFCGRELNPALAGNEVQHGEPTCNTCLRSDPWRGVQQDALGDLVFDLAKLDPLAGYRAGLAAVEHVLWSYLQQFPNSPEVVERFALFVRWAIDPSGKPPTPRADPEPWDPAGLGDEGAASWLYGLGCAALSFDQRTPSGVAHDLRMLMRPVTDWTMNTGTGMELIEAVAGTIRERVIPFLLGEADPLPVLAHQLETTALPRARSAD